MIIKAPFVIPSLLFLLLSPVQCAQTNVSVVLLGTIGADPPVSGSTAILKAARLAMLIEPGFEVSLHGCRIEWSADHAKETQFAIHQRPDTDTGRRSGHKSSQHSVSRSSDLRPR